MIHPPVSHSLELLPEYQSTPIIPVKDGYIVDEVKFHRVTTVLQVVNKPALGNWIKKTTLDSVRESFEQSSGTSGQILNVNAEWIDDVLEKAKGASDKARDDAADKGSNIHNTLADMFVRRWDDKNLHGAAAAAAQFIDDRGFTLEAVEVPLWSDLWRVAGTCDVVARRKIDNARVIWDWKTGSGPWPEMAFQLGAYSKMIEILTGERVAMAYIVHVNENGYSCQEVDDLREAEEAFDVVAQLYKIMRRQWFANKVTGKV